MEHLVEVSQGSSNKVEMVEHKHSLWEEMEVDSHLNSSSSKEVKEDSQIFSLNKEDDYIIT